jgi:hypothetical protein
VTRRLIAAVALILGALALAPTTAHAQYPTSCGFILDPPVIAVGGTVNIIGSLFGPGTTVTFFIENPETGARQVLGTVTADDDADGNVEASFPLPPGFNQDGTYTISAQCPDGQIASNVLIVGAGGQPGTTATGQQLPVTGSDTPLTLARIALMLVAVGGILLLVTRRRAQQQASSRT